jgi:glycosyltransferase involved in cell wall biosynthesis
MKKKIAYILSRFPTVSETFILYEIIELRKLGAEIDIFPLVHQKGAIIHAEVETLAPRVHYYHFFSLASIRDHVFWLHKKPKTYIQTVLRVIAKNMRSLKFLSRAIIVVLQSAQTARIIEETGAELIHAHSATHPALMAYIVSSLTGIPYSFTAHSSDIYFNQTMLDEKIQHARFVATISEYNRMFLQNIYPNISTGKIKVVHCGIDPAKFQKPAQRISNLINIICVGRLEKVKGHKFLIEACAQLKAQNVDFSCYLVGDGELRSQIQQQINRLNLADQVKILGFQPHQQVVELLAKADVLIQPSISEGIPVAVMEGMAMGIPVVASSVTGVPELVIDGTTGLLVPSQDTMALTEAIIKLYKFPELRKQLGKSGRTKVITDFNLQQSAKELYKIFQEV